MTKRVTFYSIHDMAFSMEYSKVRERTKYLLKLDKPKLMDILELTQISLYLSTVNTLQKKSVEEIEINKKVKKWFAQVPIDELLKELTESDLSPQYEDEFWKLIVLMKYSQDKVEQILERYTGYRIVYPMRNKRIVQNYGDKITEKLVEYKESAEIIISRTETGVNLPGELLGEVENRILTKYIRRKDARPELLRELYLDDHILYSIRLKARKKYEYYENKILNADNFPHIDSTTEVEIVDAVDGNKDFDIREDENGRNVKLAIRINRTHLLDLMDWPTILNNLKFVFGLMDSAGILTMAPFNEQGGVLERIMSPRDNLFPATFHFEETAAIHLSTFIAYYTFLQQQGVQLERIMEWFFDDYLTENFQVEGLNISLVDGLSSPVKFKTLNAMSQLHRIMRMYNLFSTDKHFDRDLIDSFSDTPHPNEIGSIARDKYIEISNGGLLYAQQVLFSDQSPLPSSDDARIGDSIARGDSEWSDFGEYQTGILNQLVRLQILRRDGQKVVFASSSIHPVLRFSFLHGVVPSLQFDPLRNNSLLNRWISNDLAGYRSTLLTPYEADLFDYYFSDRYPNGLGLRNKYAHGAFNSMSSAAHSTNYFACLLFIAFLILKINDELDCDDRRKRFLNT